MLLTLFVSYIFLDPDGGILMIHTVFETFVVCYADEAYIYINNNLVSMNAVELSSIKKWNPP